MKTFIQKLGALRHHIQSATLNIKPTARALALLLVPAPLFAASGALPLLILPGIALLLGGAVLLLVDAVLTPPPDSFDVQRIHNQELSLGVDNPVEIAIYNRNPRPVIVQVRDEYPPDFVVPPTQRRLVALIKKYKETRLSYTIRPPRRGDYEFGNVRMRWRSVLGLLTFESAYATETPIKVYPNLFKLREYQLLMQRGRLNQIGVRPSRIRGEGMEFEQLRDYLPDDDYRRICWTATARRGKPITIDYQTERSQNIIFMIDIGRQMLGYSPAEALTRLDHVVNTVLLFSYIATINGDRVGMMIFADEIDAYLPPRPGRGQIYRMLETLYDVEARSVEPDYARAIRYLRTRRERRALIILFTDLTSEEGANELIPHFGALYPHHLPLCVMLSDTAVKLAVTRPLYNIGAVYQRAIAEQMLDARQVWLDTLKQRGVITLDVQIHTLTAAVINQYLQIKAKARI